MQNYFSNDSNKFYEVMLYNNICPPSMQCTTIYCFSVCGPELLHIIGTCVSLKYQVFGHIWAKCLLNGF